MDEIRSMLESENGALVLQAADRINISVMMKRREADKTTEYEELNLLWELIGSKKISCSNSCRYLLVHFIKVGIIEPIPAITQLLAKLSLGYCHTGIVGAISQILALMVKNSHVSIGGYKSPYLINTNQHPFISILRSIPKSWDLVLDQMFYLLDHNDVEVRQHAVVLLKPVYLFLFCDPNYHIHFGALRSVLFNDILERCKKDEKYVELAKEIVAWLPYTQQDSIRESCHYIAIFIKFLIQNNLTDLLKERTLLLSSLIKHQISFGFSIRDTLGLLRECKSVVDDWDSHFIILNQGLQISPLGSEMDLLLLCEELLTENKISKYVAGSLVCPLLESLSFDSTFSPSTVKKADIVRFCLKNNFDETEIQPRGNTKIFPYFESTISNAVATSNTFRIISSSQLKRQEWLDKLSSTDHICLANNMSIISSIFLFTNNTQELQAALNLLHDITKENATKSSAVLTLILHKLASAEKNSEPSLYLALLQTLPKMAADKNCVSLILKLVGSLACKTQLSPLRLRLLTTLWRQEPRSFQFLHKALEEVPDSTVFTEVQIARAMVMKDIVSTHADQHGSDLLPLLSAILNQCTSPQVTVAASLAMQSIYILCKQSVIDIRTTIKVIGPKCSKDGRSKVVEQYCNILSLIPTFKVTGSEYAKFTDETVSWLWKKVSSNESADIVCSALNALAAFPLECTKLKMLPSYCRQDVKLPASYCATPQDAARKPEDVLPYVPGSCWINLLTAKNKQVQQAKIDMLTSLLRTEIKDLPNSVYHPNKSMRNETEPLNFNHLPDHSILRAVIAFIIQNKEDSRLKDGCDVSNLQVVLSLLTIDYGRHLPPLDWLSLDYLLHRSELRYHFIKIVSIQAATSRSARMILERQLCSELDMETSMTCLQCLQYICLVAPPPALTSFMNRCLQLSLNKCIDGGCSEPITKCLDAITTSINQPNIPEQNKLTLSSCLENMFDKFPEDLEVFQHFLDTVCLLPNKSIERLSSPAIWWEATPEKLAKAAHLRAKLALRGDSDCPLIWFNELLEQISGSSSSGGDSSYMLRHMMNVMHTIRVKSSKSVISWLLELMGQISAKLRKPGGEGSTLFLLDIFSITVILLTETDTFSTHKDDLCVARSTRQSLLPLAMHRLSSGTAGLSGQLADWTIRLANKNLPGGYTNCLQESLPVFKCADNWKESFMWARIVVH